MNRRTALAAAAALPLAAVGALAGQERTPGAPGLAAPPSPIPVADELRALLTKQAAQWTAGDLTGFCSHYADDAIFVSPSGRTDGRAAVEQRYLKKYVDKRGMGALTLEVLHVIADGGVASIAMRWRLAFDGKPPAEGYSVIGLERRAGAWKIAHDASM